jgi:hypothetical protein
MFAGMPLALNFSRRRTNVVVQDENGLETLLIDGRG